MLASFIHHDRPRLMQGPGIATFRVCFVSGLQMTLPMYKTAIGEDRDIGVLGKCDVLVHCSSTPCLLIV